jgi:hypothetical protein
MDYGHLRRPSASAAHGSSRHHRVIRSPCHPVLSAFQVEGCVRKRCRVPAPHSRSQNGSGASDGSRTCVLPFSRHGRRGRGTRETDRVRTPSVQTLHVRSPLCSPFAAALVVCYTARRRGNAPNTHIFRVHALLPAQCAGSRVRELKMAACSRIKHDLRSS